MKAQKQNEEILSRIRDIKAGEKNNSLLTEKGNVFFIGERFELHMFRRRLYLLS
ncbi:MAG: hypothetical protein ACYSTS_12740 [Planctomycetota bacterium]|jgi:hypothetical protein